jgi:hypothetical protein
LPQKARRKVPTALGFSLLIVAEAFGIALLYLSSIVTQAVVQAILFLISMVIIWYAAHPLSHFVVAKFCGVRTLFFFIGPSDMGKSGPSIAQKISPFLITVGTKLDSPKLVVVSRNRRAWIFGSGALVGVIILAVIESFAILDFKFGILSLVLGGLFFLLTVGTELVLSTKSGDLSKMKKELSKPK